MNMSFYTAVRGAMTEEAQMGIISNNISNVNTAGYKTKAADFQELMYYNMQPDPAGTGKLAGTGSRIAQTESIFSQGALQKTGGTYDFAIQGNGFFVLQNPADQSLTYTRNGAFRLSQREDGFYLASASGKLVLDAGQNPIRLQNGELSAAPAVFGFANTNGMENIGDGELIPVEKNGAAVLAEDSAVQNGMLEMSNVDLAEELSKVIRSSRAYSYMLKMVQTSDETEQTINSLKA